MHHQRKVRPLEAFCAACPDPQEVTAFLRPMGFSLAFHMDEIPVQQCASALPAQYHYEDHHGTQVLYLAGRDDAGMAVRFPSHASRWWVIPGSSHERYTRVVDSLALRWFLLWLSSRSVCVAEHQTVKGTQV